VTDLPRHKNDREPAEWLDADADRLRAEPDAGFEGRVARAVRVGVSPVGRVRPSGAGRHPGARWLPLAAGLALATGVTAVVLVMRPAPTPPASPAPTILSVEAFERDLDLWLERLAPLAAHTDQDPTPMIESLEAVLDEPLARGMTDLAEESL